MSVSESVAPRIPDRLKRLLSTLLVYLRRLGRNPVKEFEIRMSQDRLLREHYSRSTNRLIVFLTPGRDIVNGGILSISSIYEQTTKLYDVHRAQVIMCTIPGHPSLLRYTKFANQNYLYRFSMVLSYFRNLQHLMIHIPELCIEQFIKNTSSADHLRLAETNTVRINIMLQNIQLLPPTRYIDELRRFGQLTCTTAHEQYTTPELRSRLGMPLHRLSAYVSPEQYKKTEYVEKEDLIVISPDKHTRKSEVLRLIGKQFPQLQVLIVKNLTYEEYKDTIAKAKWSLTFGEGLDGYFLETIFSGGVSFAVHNPIFFTDDFRSLRTVYDNFDMLAERICTDMRRLDNETAYSNYQTKQYRLCCKHYNTEQYVRNLESFYRGEYTFA